jgi:hypothetical protein
MPQPNIILRAALPQSRLRRRAQSQLVRVAAAAAAVAVAAAPAPPPATYPHPVHRQMCRLSSHTREPCQARQAPTDGRRTDSGCDVPVHALVIRRTD